MEQRGRRRHPEALPRRYRPRQESRHIRRRPAHDGERRRERLRARGDIRAQDEGAAGEGARAGDGLVGDAGDEPQRQGLRLVLLLGAGASAPHGS